MAATFGVRELAPAVAAEAVTRKSHTGWLCRGRNDGGGPAASQTVGASTFALKKTLATTQTWTHALALGVGA